MVMAFSLLLLPVNAAWTRAIAFSVSVVIFCLAFYIYQQFDPHGGMQFREYHPWIKSYGIHYSLGLDGFSLIVLMLIATLIPSAYLLLWKNNRSKSYWISMLLIQSGISGTLFSLDLILFYFFWEAMLLPVFMIIGQKKGN